MKFDLGTWRVLPGVDAAHPVTITDVGAEPGTLTITGFSHPVNARSDLLEGTIITARFSSPMPDVIRVQLTHFKGRRERLPVFDLDYGLVNQAARVEQVESQTRP